jgi:hypothetical protein
MFLRTVMMVPSVLLILVMLLLENAVMFPSAATIVFLALLIPAMPLLDVNIPFKAVAITTLVL